MARLKYCQLAVVIVVLIVGGGTAIADALMLRDGRLIDGVKMELLSDAILLRYKHGTVRVPLDRVEDYVIEGTQPFEPRTEEEKEKRAAGLVPFRGKWVKPAVRKRELEREIRKKREEIEEHRRHQKWVDAYQFDTKNFKFRSTLPPRVNDEYAAAIQAYFSEFKKLWKVGVPKDWGKLDVCFYHDRDAFLRTSGAKGGTLAYYRFVEPRELDFYYDGKDPEKTIAVLFHEVNHYLTDLIAERFHHPHWVNEGMAEYYGAAAWDPVKERLTLGGIQHGRLAEIRSEIDGGKHYPLVKMLESESGEYAHYYWGWSFIHFMMETPKYSKKFRRFFVDMARARDAKHISFNFGMKTVSGQECLRIFKSRLGVKDLAKLEKEWYAYIDKLDSSAVRGLEQAGISAYRKGRSKFRAPRFLKAAIDAGSVNTEVYTLYAKCLAMKDAREEAAKLMEKACELDPLDADLWAQRGFLLIQLDRAEEGERYIELAKEMNPDDDYLALEIMRKLREVGKKGD